MFIVGMLSWWYTLGWKKVATVLVEKLASTEDFFSIDILISNLFAPYKQISASGSGLGTFQDKVREWFDKQFSRVFGAIIRLLIVIVGVVWLFTQIAAYIFVLFVWPLVPILPLVGLVVMIAVGTPWSL